MVNEVTFVGFRGAIPPTAHPRSALFVMHPCEPYRSGAPHAYFGTP